jgi:hypothetical protein
LLLIATAIVANAQKVVFETTMASGGEVAFNATELAWSLCTARGAHPSPAATSRRSRARGRGWARLLRRSTGRARLLLRGPATTTERRIGRGISREPLRSELEAALLGTEEPCVEFTWFNRGIPTTDVLDKRFIFVVEAIEDERSKFLIVERLANG